MTSTSPQKGVSSRLEILAHMARETPKILADVRGLISDAAGLISDALILLVALLVGFILAIVIPSWFSLPTPKSK